MNEKQRVEITNIVNNSLDRAEKHWAEGGHELVAKAAINLEALDSAIYESEQSKIPGHPWVSEDKTTIDEFIAIVADMRDSSEHLQQAISARIASVSQLQRVFYETSALLPALAKTMKFHEGNVTEFLGDGVLALFQVDPHNKEKTMYAARRAANDSMNDTRDIINSILRKRYSLPAINLGIGMAMSKTIVTLIGLDGEKHPKAFGECVFRATKLSSGINEVCVDDFLYHSWPSSKTGSVRFKPCSKNGISGYIMSN